MRQIPFTLHPNAGNADKQGISEGEGLSKALHPPFTTLHQRLTNDKVAIIQKHRLVNTEVA